MNSKEGRQPGVRHRLKHGRELEEFLLSILHSVSSSYSRKECKLPSCEFQFPLFKQAARQRPDILVTVPKLPGKGIRTL